MIILAPGFLVLAFLVVPVVLMYVLRLRRPERTISSVLLWPRLVGDMQANAPWQRLRPSIFLVLQVLALLALVAALAHPAYSRTSVISRDVIVVLDQSFSMQARDVTPSRFAAAQARAHALAHSLPSGNVMSVIGMSAQPHLAIAESQDVAALDHAIDALQPENATANVLAALTLASSLARQGEATDLQVLTDHSSGITHLPLPVSFPVEITRYGGMRRDLGITSFTASGGQHPRAALRLHNYGSDRASTDLDLYGDGHLLDVQPVDVAAGADDSATWDTIPPGTRRLEARLKRKDDMPADKTAWAVVATAQRRQIRLVTSGNYFLQTALSLDPSVHLDTVTPQHYTPSPPADVTIFDRVLPRSLPSGSLLLIDPPRSAGGIGVGGRVSLGNTPLAATSGDRQGILRYVDLSDVHVARARSIHLPQWMQPVAAAGTHPILAVGDDGSARLALLAFSLQESDWPLRISFPVALRNLMAYLAPDTLVGTGTFRVGQSVTLIPPAGTHSITVLKPGGGHDTIAPPFPPFADTQRRGVYVVRSIPGGTAAEFAANSFATPKGDVPGPSALHLGRSSQVTPRRVSLPVDLSWTLAILALGLLGTEWWMTFRR